MTNRPALALYGTSQDCVSLVPRQISDAGVNRWYESMFSCDSHLLKCQRSVHSTQLLIAQHPSLRRTRVLRCVGGESKPHLAQRQAARLYSFCESVRKPLSVHDSTRTRRFRSRTTFFVFFVLSARSGLAGLVRHTCNGSPDLHRGSFSRRFVRKK